MGYDLKFRLLQKCENPHQREANLLQAYNAPFLVVGPKSPLSWRKAVDDIALYCKRELGFEGFLYSYEEESLETLMDRVLVFHGSQIVERKPTGKNRKDHTSYYVFWGAVCMRRRMICESPQWGIAWAWLHPYERGNGHLVNAWPLILKMFPNPFPEEPISPAMTAFLKKVGYTFNPEYSSKLIFDLLYQYVQQEKQRIEAARKGNPAVCPAPIDTAIRLHPNDFSIARRQLYERTATIHSDDKRMCFEYWVDWTLIPDPAQPLLLANLDLKRVDETSRLPETMGPTRFEKMTNEEFLRSAPRTEQEVDAYEKEAKFREWYEEQGYTENPPTDEAREEYAHVQRETSWDNIDHDDTSGYEDNMTKD